MARSLSLNGVSRGEINVQEGDDLVMILSLAGGPGSNDAVQAETYKVDCNRPGIDFNPPTFTLPDDGDRQQTFLATAQPGPCTVTVTHIDAAGNQIILESFSVMCQARPAPNEPAPARSDAAQVVVNNGTKGTLALLIVALVMLALFAFPLYTFLNSTYDVSINAFTLPADQQRKVTALESLSMLDRTLDVLDGAAATKLDVKVDMGEVTISADQIGMGSTQTPPAAPAAP